MQRFRSGPSWDDLVTVYSRPANLAKKLPAFAGRTMQAEIEALSKALDKPILVHVVTQKGKGHAPAEDDPAGVDSDRTHITQQGAQHLGDTAAAVKLTEKATLLDPQSAAAFSNFGVALDANGEYARAEAAYRHSLDLDPENTTTLLNLGTNLIKQNKGTCKSSDAKAALLKEAKRLLETMDED